MSKGRATQALLALVSSLLLRTVVSQFIFYNGPQQLIYGQRGLQSALDDPDVTTIYISGNVSINATDPPWRTPPVITNRSLLFVGYPDSQVTNEIDFGGVVSVLVVGEGAEVEFRNLTLSHPGPQNLKNSTDPYAKYRTESVGAWPSLVVLDGARIFFNSTILYYYSQIQWSRCGNFAAKVKFELTENRGYQNVTIPDNNNATLLISEHHTFDTNITDITNNKSAGTAVLETLNTTMTCVSDPFVVDASTSGAPAGAPTPGDSGRGFKWWYGLIIALGAVVFLAAVAAIVLAVCLRRRRRKASLDSAGPSKEVSLTTPGSRSASEEQKPWSVQPSGSLPPTIQDLNDMESGRGPPVASVEPIDSVVSQFSGSAADPEAGVSAAPSSYGKGSGPISESGFSWADVTALLRARSDFSDVEVGPLIGRGSFGRVYKGRWKGAFVAIKIVDHQEAASKVIAMREGTLSHSVQHPNVITTYSVFLQHMQPHQRAEDQEGWAPDQNPPEDAMEGIPERTAPSFTEEQEHFATCLLLEYADRGTLEKAMMSGKFSSRTGEIDLKGIHRTLLDIAGGMDYLHSVGVLHGDLKAANVLLKSTATDARGFTCKLADFGMARVLDTNRTHVSTQTYGTISYMPPELLKEGKLTRAVDSYSFAIIMWELFSGAMLHSGLTIPQVFYKICYENAKPPMPASMPEEYQDLMSRCWNDAPSLRPTFSEIFEYLQAIPSAKAGLRTSPSFGTGSARNSDAAAVPSPNAVSPRPSGSDVPSGGPLVIPPMRNAKLPPQPPVVRGEAVPVPAVRDQAEKPPAAPAEAVQNEAAPPPPAELASPTDTGSAEPIQEGAAADGTGTVVAVPVDPQSERSTPAAAAAVAGAPPPRKSVAPPSPNPFAAAASAPSAVPVEGRVPEPKT